MSKTYILFELDKGLQLPTTEPDWIRENPNVWKITYSWNPDEERTFAYGLGAWGYGFYGSSGTTTLPADVPRVPVLKAESLIVDGTSYEKVNSVAECGTVDESFYFDVAAQILYVNFDAITYPWDYSSIALGVTKGYSNFPIIVDSVQYEARIVNIPNIEQKRDALFFGVVSFEGGSIELVNKDHHFDTIYLEDVYGQECRIRYSEDGSSFTTAYTGNYQTESIGDNISITVKDKRKTLSRKISVATYTKSQYIGLDDEDIGKPIQIGYGQIKKGVGIYIGSNTYKFVDTDLHSIQYIGTVYVDNKPVTPASKSLVDGTVTLTTGTFEVGDDVYVDFVGYNITNPLEIIEDLIEYYLEIPYTSTFYNTTSWELAKAAVTPNIQLYIFDEQESLIDVIGKIASSVFGTFIVDGDGKFNFKVIDNTTSPVKTIKKIDYIAQPKPKTIAKENITSTKVTYLEAYGTEKKRSYTDRSQENSLFYKYKIYKQQEFETLVLTETQAEEFAAKAMELYGGLFQTWTLKTKMQTLDVELEDIVTAELFYDDYGNFYTLDLEVIGKTVDYINKEITLVGRCIIPTFEYTIPSNLKIIRR